MQRSVFDGIFLSRNGAFAPFATAFLSSLWGCSADTKWQAAISSLCPTRQHSTAGPGMEDGVEPLTGDGEQPLTGDGEQPLTGSRRCGTAMGEGQRAPMHAATQGLDP